MDTFRRTPSVADTYGLTLTLKQVCQVLGIGKTTAHRRLKAGTFPVPSLPRHKNDSYHFAAIQVDRYLARAMAEPVAS